MNWNDIFHDLKELNFKTSLVTMTRIRRQYTQKKQKGFKFK